ncbi:hypothetical protein BU23DRAFT_556512 [Bimuria novae-zelandiae CBS 107.79]|uniref:Uncharacterized protein n=1 Tax=Bimuria novae-zelandiae CBS 107.79 TaxID=1447943 RepID=A0A6A5V0J8_9PLEO|nr:hypothetical protein BU23DRAFT_556512 [Bimuria novae-zelandiae CBS 107.79]
MLAWAEVYLLEAMSASDGDSDGSDCGAADSSAAAAVSLSLGVGSSRLPGACDVSRRNTRLPGVSICSC